MPNTTVAFLKRLPWFPYEAWAGISFVLLMLLAALWAIPIYLLFGKRAHPIYFPAYKGWAKGWFWLNGIRFVLDKRHLEESPMPAILVANHSCHLDLLNGAAASPIRVKALAKIELKKIPVLGLLFQTASVFVDRRSPQSRETSFEALKATLAAGYSLFMFPEGSRNRSQEPLTKFYDGAFRLAVATQLPILPLVFTGTTGVMPMQGIKLRPGTIRASYLKAQWPDMSQENPVEELKQRSFALMEEFWIKLQVANESP